MFILNRNYEIDQKTLEYDYIKFSRSEISTLNTANSQIYINIRRENSVVSLLNSCLDITFDKLHAATNNRCADGFDIRLINLGSLRSFSVYKLTTSS